MISQKTMNKKMNTDSLHKEQLKLYIDWCQTRNLKNFKINKKTNLADISSQYFEEKNQQKDLSQVKILALSSLNEDSKFFTQNEEELWKKMIQALGFDPQNEVKLLSIETKTKQGRSSSHENHNLKSKLYSELKCLQAKFLLILGQEAYNYLWPKQKNWQSVLYKTPSFKLENQIRHVFLIPHPSQLISKPLLKKPTWICLQKIKELNS